MPIEPPARTPRSKTNRTRCVILGLLQERPLSAYDIRKEIQHRISHFWSESFGQIYPVLKRMTADRVVLRRSRKRFGRVYKLYELTAAGEAELNAWLAQAPTYETPRNEVFLRIYLAGEHDPEQVRRALRNLQTHRRSTLHRAHQMLAAQNGDEDASPLRRALLEYAIAADELALRWCERMLSSLATSPEALAHVRLQLAANPLSQALE